MVARSNINRPAYVYVVNHLRRCSANSGDRGDCVYVGSTELLPEERLERHRSGARTSSRSSRQLGVGGLREDLYDYLNPCSSREEADRVEQDLASLLATAGWCVHGGTGGTPFDDPVGDGSKSLEVEEVAELMTLLRSKMCSSCRNGAGSETHRACAEIKQWLFILAGSA